jgi:chemotaxis protein CheD
MQKIYLTPGTLWCGSEPSLVSTVLGSCVAVCLIDRHQRAAGMNHFILPQGISAENNLRYGDISLDRMLDRMFRMGCHRNDLRAKIFGGAAVLAVSQADSVGTKNVELSLAWLAAHEIPILARRTGGRHGMTLRFDTGTGEVLARSVMSSTDVAIRGPLR